MASLTGNQINNSYQGLLKTEDNAALPAGLIAITDGVGNPTGLALNAGANEFQFEKGNVEYSLMNSNFTRTSYPMSATPGDSSYLNFKDSTGAYTGWLSLDRYGSMYYTNTHGDQGESHVFVSQTGAGAYAPAVIRMNTYNSINNSNNWFTGYEQSPTSLSFNSGTGDLTLNRQSATPLVVNIPAGGTPGLVAGTGTGNMQSAAFLTPTAALAQGTHAIAIGNNARTTTAAYNGNISIGDGAASNNWHSIAIGSAVNATGQFSVSIGSASSATGSQTNTFGRDANNVGNFSLVLGSGNRIFGGDNNNIIGGTQNQIPNGTRNVMIGGSFLTFPSGQFDNITIGNVNGIGSGSSNCTVINLGAQVGDNSGESVAIGFNATVGNNAIYGTAIGGETSVTAQQATALGYQAVAANLGWTATKKLELNDYATLNYADDTAAAAGGVPLGGIYHNAGALRIRIV